MFLWCHDHCFQPKRNWLFCRESYPLCIWRFTQGRWPAKSANKHTPVAPGQPPEIQATICSTKSASASSFHHQAAAPNQHQLPVSTTRQQHQITISFQSPPPGSSTKSASSFYHQAAAPHQPASSKASSQSAVNSTTLPHPHHGSQVCCCLDILWLFSSIII